MTSSKFILYSPMRQKKKHVSGELEKAIHFYKLSIEKKPTARAHTFLDWALSHQGKTTK
ncbi:MAG: hypothetical protein GTO13_09445 [Proteobacteria bacterium]|nr:hypothetical protein [Pseudomonadota bacterium]